MGRLQEVAAAPGGRSHPLANQADLSTSRTGWIGNINALLEILEYILVSTPIDLLWAWIRGSISQSTEAVLSSRSNALRRASSFPVPLL